MMLALAGAMGMTFGLAGCFVKADRTAIGMLALGAVALGGALAMQLWLGPVAHAATFTLSVDGYDTTSGNLVPSGGGPGPTPRPQPTPGPNQTPPPNNITGCSQYVELLASGNAVGPGVWQTKTMKVGAGQRSYPCFQITTPINAKRVRVEIAKKCLTSSFTMSVWPLPGQTYSDGNPQPTYLKTGRSANYGSPAMPAGYVPKGRWRIAVDGGTPGSDCGGQNAYDLIVRVD